MQESDTVIPYIRPIMQMTIVSLTIWNYSTYSSEYQPLTIILVDCGICINYGQCSL